MDNRVSISYTKLIRMARSWACPEETFWGQREGWPEWSPSYISTRGLPIAPILAWHSSVCWFNTPFRCVIFRSSEWVPSHGFILSWGMENDKFKIVLSDAIVGAGGKFFGMTLTGICCPRALTPLKEHGQISRPMTLPTALINAFLSCFAFQIRTWTTPLHFSHADAHNSHRSPIGTPKHSPCWVSRIFKSPGLPKRSSLIIFDHLPEFSSILIHFFLRFHETFGRFSNPLVGLTMRWTFLPGSSDFGDHMDQMDQRNLGSSLAMLRQNIPFFLPPQHEEIHPEKERKIGSMDLDSSHTLIITRYHRDVRSSTFRPHPRTGQVPNGMATFRLPVSIGKQLWGNFGATYQCGLCKDDGDPSNCPFFHSTLWLWLTVRHGSHGQ